jgi:hypothetical protein
VKRRFFQFEGMQIPIRRDEATEFYEVDEEGNLISPRPFLALLGDGSWVREGQEFYVNRLGERQKYEIVLVEYEIEHHQKRGLYGQLRRRVAVRRVPDWREIEEIFRSQAKGENDELPF